ncbi:glycosyltransferase [Escherichia coli]|uniref:glycosyltransferase n=1 Tax=Escherichia coli TaxID=562 RepID=UPI000CF184F1|nr:glycosyltransferase [Escherichia coli]EEV9321795.1 glycosyltransferase [Escherichia coli]EEW5975204.1 glycosyltransferase [Escherichia coli]EFJ2085539.1 glycosyltransferase [Escherichia coli]EGI3097931.1 glycosyltransferase [Escherichia coli]EGI3154018.1 glycosyltransferase [Escherichia coli]
MEQNTKIKPLVTCCIPSYNHAQFIEAAIKSVIEQSYENIELLIIDDGSTDKSLSIINKLHKECEARFVNYSVIFRENRGLSKTLNEMLYNAKGEYITILASDDLFMPDKIATLVSFIHDLDDDYAAVFGDAEIIFNNDVNMKRMSFFKKYSKYKITDTCFDVTYSNVLHQNFIPAMSVLYRKKSLKQVGGFSESLRLEDWDIYLRLLHKCKMKCYNIPVAYYCLHGANSIFTHNKKLLEDTIKILQREKKFSFEKRLEYVWYEKYYDALFGLIIQHRYLKGIFSNFRDLTLPSIFMYLLRKILKRFK